MNIEKRLEQIELKLNSVNHSEFAIYVRKFIPGWNGTTKQAFHKFLELNKPNDEKCKKTAE